MIDIGVVVIGRNEGERLKACIHSLAMPTIAIVYVDSGSSDGSVEFVCSQGFDVVELDMSTPFSAARARNEGYRYLIQKYQDIEFIQFVDGDCQVYSEWMTCAYKHLKNHPELASVCGRRRERYPNKTLFNALCDIEWNTPVGIANATGGDFMSRKEALLDVDGFCPQVIAGEEPEMCFRMRMQGWSIERLDADMTLHDANMTKVSEWWKRNERSGHAYMQGFCMHGDSEEKYYRLDVLRIVIWALIVPLGAMLSVSVFGVYAILLLLIYPAKIAQIFLKEIKAKGIVVAFAYSSGLVLGKFPQFKGIATFLVKHVLGKKLQIIEYKT